MTVIAVTAAKSSPGVSTVAEVMAQLGVPENRRVLVDADPSGGEWLLRAGVAHEPGLASLAVASRRGLAPGEVAEHVQRLGDGLGVIVAPAAARQVTSALELVGASLVDHLRADGVDAVVDCGMLSALSPALPVVRAADLLVLVSRSTPSGLVHLAPWAEQLGGEGVPLALVLVDHGHKARREAAYSEADVAEALGVEVLGTMADDPDSAARLFAEPGRLARLANSRLVRSMRPVATAAHARAAAAGTRSGQGSAPLVGAAPARAFGPSAFGSSPERTVEEEVAER